MIFLIGGFGFIGCNILRELESQNLLEKVIVIDDFSNASEKWKDFDVNFLKGDYSSKEILNEIKKIQLSNSKFVLLAGETRVAESSERPLDFLDSNIVKPSKLVDEVLKSGDELILISTAGALYSGNTTITLNLAPEPKNFYGTTKLVEELILQSLCKLKEIKFKIIRFTNVYGAYADKKKSALHAFVKRALNKEAIIVNGDGNQRRDFIFASDVAKSLIKVLNDQKEDSHIFAYGKSYAINDIVKILQSKFTSLNVEFLKNNELIKTEPRNVEVSQSAISKFFDGKVDLQEGIDKLINEYKNK